MTRDYLIIIVYEMMLKNIDGSANWASKAERVLCDNTLEHYWSAQGISDERAFFVSNTTISDW